MSYTFLLLASFFGAFGLGYAKFFGMTHLAEGVYGGDSKSWVIQAVGSLMTLGPTLAYVMAGPLAASMRKRNVMTVGAVAAALAAIIGATLAEQTALAVWIGLFAIGFSMGIFSAGKMSSAPLQAECGKLSIFAVNAGLSVAFLGGILSGAYFGTLGYKHMPLTGGVVVGGLFLLTALLARPCRYPTESTRKFVDTLGELGSETVSLLLRFPLFLLASPLLWGVAGASVLAVTAYAETCGLGGAAACSLMSLYAAVGTIVGNLASPPMARRRMVWAFSLAVGMAAMVAALPVMIILCRHAGASPSSAYYVVAGYIVILGFFFGAATNLIDSEYLRRVRLVGKEGAGAALQSAMTAVFSFVVGGIIGLAIYKEWLNPSTQFLILSLLSCLSVLGFMALALAAGELDPFLRPMLRIFSKTILAVRYKVRVEGLEKLPRPARGLLILPNHPAEIDPVILVTWLWQRCEPRPVVTERFFADNLLARFIKLTRAFPIPDMEMGTSRYKTMRIERTLADVVAALKAGDNVIIYPAGRLASSGFERLGASSGVSTILRAAPKATVVLASTKGLWGSSFSKALTGGSSPDFVRAFTDGAWAALRNLIFLTPKRAVTVSLSIPQDFPRDAEPLKINQYLESFYNAKGEEPLSRPPVDFWQSSSSQPTAAEGSGVIPDLSNVDPAILDAVRRFLSSKLGIAMEKIKPESKLADDLGADSLMKAEVMVWLEEEYLASNIEMASLRTVADVTLAAAGAASQAAADKAAVMTPTTWMDAGQRLAARAPDGTTLQEAFLRCCDRMGNTAAIADDLRGVVTWRGLKTAVLVLADVFRKLPGERLGLMLPASAGASMCIIATLLARKVPVMMNWTVGRRNLEVAASLSGIEKVVTSGAFLDKLVIADFGDVESKFVFLEDLRTEIGVVEKLFGALLARRGAAHLMKELELGSVRPEDPAVILFTSGSEASPKGVPLSHNNILADLRAAIEVMRFEQRDILLAFLPPFHSFGFTACVMFPLVSGLKTAYFPNPTDGRRIAEACRKWQATIMLGTPTFVAAVLKASKEDVRTLRWILVGAEKAPPSLFEAVKALGTGAVLDEGYGITECSPVISLSLPGDPPESVGRPLPGVELLIIDPESHKPLPIGTRGLILARGPSVFSGYLGGKPDPFVEVDGKKWYSTGDLGFLTPQGYLVLAGRMKRFVKVAGEMISLPAIEEALSAQWTPDENGPALAVKAFEKEDGARPDLVLFSSRHIFLENANEALKTAGFSNLSRINRVVELEAIPLLGSGKTDYQRLAPPAA